LTPWGKRGEKLIDARKRDMFATGKIYAEQRAQALGISAARKHSIKI